MYEVELSIDRGRLIELMCYGLGQGDKLANATDPYKQGQHVEAIRRTYLKIVKQFPDDFVDELMEAFQNQQNEGGDKP